MTAAGAANRLAAEYPGSAELLEEALGSYRAWRGGGPDPEKETADALRRLIESLPAFGSPNDPASPATTLGGSAA